MTQADLAMMAHTVISLEQRRQLPSLDLARHFGQQVEDLFRRLPAEMQIEDTPRNA